jgi:hypothetical protein
MLQHEHFGHALYRRARLRLNLACAPGTEQFLVLAAGASAESPQVPCELTPFRAIVCEVLERAKLSMKFVAALLCKTVDLALGTFPQGSRTCSNFFRG